MAEEVSQTTKNIVAKELYKIIHGYSNPDLAIAILYCIDNGVSSRQYVDFIHKRLEVEEAAISNIMTYLVLDGFIMELEHKDRSLNEVCLTNEAELFVKSEILGPYYIIKDKILDVIDTGRVMNAIGGLVNFYYSKEVEIPAKKLEELKKETYSSIEDIEKREMKYIRNLLNLSENEKIAWGISFISKRDPTKNEYGSLKSVNLTINMKFPSPNEALKQGFLRAKGYLKSDVKAKEEHHLMLPDLHSFQDTVDIKKINNNQYELNICNIRYYNAVREGTFAYMQEAKKKMEKLTEIVNSILK